MPNKAFLCHIFGWNHYLNSGVGYYYSEMILWQGIIQLKQTVRTSEDKTSAMSTKEVINSHDIKEIGWIKDGRQLGSVGMRG